MNTISFTIQIGSHAHAVNSLSDHSTLDHLAEIVHSEIKLQPESIKFIIKGKSFKPSPEITLKQAGIQSQSKVRVMGSTTAQINAVKNAQEPKAMPGFDHEIQRELRRQIPASATPSPPTGQKYTFHSFESWQGQGIDLYPPPPQALKLLHKLSTDPGICYLMNTYKWNVLKLSEMPPQGKVGISPVCILGVNINKGQEISLRLRTDDLKGFRKYDKIKETLIHELAHMIFGDHDNDFKQFNSKLRKEADAADWTLSQKAIQTITSSGGTVHSVRGGLTSAAPTLHKAIMKSSIEATSTTIGKTLRELAGNAIPGSTSTDTSSAGIPMDRAAREAAGAAAMRRDAASKLQSYPVQDLNASPGASPAVNDSDVLEHDVGIETDLGKQREEEFPEKGESVLYRQRDGSWVPATVVNVDYSVIPPSVGIELPGNSPGESPQYRETELNRIKKVRIGVEEEGMGHFDALTQQKEDAVELMERI